MQFVYRQGTPRKFKFYSVAAQFQINFFVKVSNSWLLFKFSGFSKVNSCESHANMHQCSELMQIFKDMMPACF